MTRPEILAEAQAPSSSSTATILLMGIVLVALAVVIGAMEAGAASLHDAAPGDVHGDAGSARAAEFIGLCLLCLVIVLAVQLRGTGSH